MMFADRELVLGSEAARRLGLSRERVRQLAADPRQAFPAPIGRFSTGGDPRGDRIVWDWAEVERWGHAHGHTAAVTAWRDVHASLSSDIIPDTLAPSGPPTAPATRQRSRRRSRPQA
jgi:hypothetical protein